MSIALPTEHPSLPRETWGPVVERLTSMGYGPSLIAQECTKKLGIPIGRMIISRYFPAEIESGACLLRESIFLKQVEVAKAGSERMLQWLGRVVLRQEEPEAPAEATIHLIMPSQASQASQANGDSHSDA